MFTAFPTRSGRFRYGIRTVLTICRSFRYQTECRVRLCCYKQGILDCSDWKRSELHKSLLRSLLDLVFCKNCSTGTALNLRYPGNAHVTFTNCQIVIDYRDCNDDNIIVLGPLSQSPDRLISRTSSLSPYIPQLLSAFLED